MNDPQPFKPGPILTQISPQDVLSSSPWHLIRILIVSVFAVELAIMLLLEPLLFDIDTSFWENLFEGLLDASLLSFVVFPILYYYAFKPLVVLIERYQQTERALDTVNTFLEIVFASLTDGVIVVNKADYHIMSCNRMAEKLLGHPQSQLIGGNIQLFLNLDETDWFRLQDEIETSLSSGRIFRTEIALNPRKELGYVAELTVNRIESAYEANTLQVYVVRDISERIKSQEQLLLQTTALEAAANGIMITNNDGLIEWINPALMEMTGFSFEELVGKDARIFNSGSHETKDSSAIFQAIQAGNVWSGELMNQRKDGSFYIEHQSIAPVRNKNHEITHFIAIKENITERKQAEIQMQRRNQELVMLGQLGQSVVSSLELPHILANVIAQVMPLIGAECLSIILREDDHLTYAATAGQETEMMQGAHVSIDKGVPGEVLRTGQLVHVTGNNSKFNLSDNDPCSPQSLIAVPLALGHNQLGLIQASHRQPQAFDDGSIRTLMTAANWAAIAISHANQLEEIRHQLNEAATLAAINQSLNETLDLDNVLQLIADSTPKLLNQADGVVIHLRNDSENFLTPAIWSGHSVKDYSSLFLELNKGLVYEVFREGKLINLPDVSQTPYADTFPHSDMPASLVIVPLKSGSHQLGTIIVQNQTRPHAFTAKDERLLLRLADSAAVAINTVRLYQSERAQRQQAEYMARTAVALSQSLEMDEVLSTILKHASEIVEGLETAVFLLRDDRIFRSQYSQSDKPNRQLSLVLQKLVAPDGINASPSLKRIMKTGKPTFIINNSEHGAVQANLSSTNQPMHVAAPLRITTETAGFVVLQSNKPGIFNHFTMSQIELLASQASLAVQNALLFNDLSEILKKEQSTRAQLVQAQKLSALGRMVASVAHELNNPLQTIKNCLFLIQQDLGEETDTQAYLEMALSESNRLTNLVVQLRDVYRPASSDKPHQVSLSDIIGQVYLILRQHLKQNNINYLFTPADSPLWVLGDANQLKQVVINICLNAIDAMLPDGGTLSLFPVMRQDKVGVAIQDTGIGIAETDKEKLFEPFFTTKDTGSGLGLAICYDIMQKYDGYIDVQSSPGKGSTFTVWLPALTK